MNNCKDVKSMRQFIKDARRQGQTIAFVPTMGALHDGHLSLIDIAKEKADIVVVSIYVNPTQFAPNEDFDDYPRTIEDDLMACRTRGVDVVFTPNEDVMYAGGAKKRQVSMQIKTLNQYLDGGSRPGFFEGIILVVNKLFNIVQPDVAVFGQKDIQQCRIIQKMVDEFHHDIEIKMAPIARDNDGLALSSRNRYLSSKERKLAPLLYKALQDIESNIKKKDLSDLRALIKKHGDKLSAKGFQMDYFDLYDFETMQPLRGNMLSRKNFVAIAAYLGKTRLIDNIILK